MQEEISPYPILSEFEDITADSNYIVLLSLRGIGASSAAQEARCKLQALNNRLFEELCSDIYDEVDRRENDAGTQMLFCTLITLTMALGP